MSAPNFPVNNPIVHITLDNFLDKYISGQSVLVFARLSGISRKAQLGPNSRWCN